MQILVSFKSNNSNVANLRASDLRAQRPKNFFLKHLFYLRVYVTKKRMLRIFSLNFKSNIRPFYVNLASQLQNQEVRVPKKAKYLIHLSNRCHCVYLIHLHILIYSLFSHINSVVYLLFQ